MNLQELNKKIMPNARTVGYGLALFAGIVTFLISPDELVLANNFGFLAFKFVSLALIVSPIRALFPDFALNGTFHRARRALGVSAFVFVLVHSSLQFMFRFEGSFDLLIQFNSENNFAVIFGFVAFVILFLFAVTSTDWAVRKLGKNWFRLHMLVYVAYPFIIWHAFQIGTDFKEMTLYAQGFFLIAAATILLEIARVVKKIMKKK